MKTNLLHFVFLFFIFIFTPYLNAKEINIYSHRQPFLINPFLTMIPFKATKKNTQCLPYRSDCRHALDRVWSPECWSQDLLVLPTLIPVPIVLNNSFISSFAVC